MHGRRQTTVGRARLSAHALARNKSVSSSARAVSAHPSCLPTPCFRSTIRKDSASTRCGAYSRQLQRNDADWPDGLLLLGDQVYADLVPPETAAFIRGRRDVSEPPGEEVADFEEYTRLYRESWSDPDIRWLLSTVPTAMIFDDHDVRDDWNISESWVAEMRSLPWWEERITGAFMAYWLYQHIGNLSPPELAEDVLLREACEDDEAGPACALLRPGGIVNRRVPGGRTTGTSGAHASWLSIRARRGSWRTGGGR